jgi:hypothetical protein
VVLRGAARRWQMADGRWPPRAVDLATKKVMQQPSAQAFAKIHQSGLSSARLGLT